MDTINKLIPSILQKTLTLSLKGLSNLFKLNK